MDCKVGRIIRSNEKSYLYVVLAAGTVRGRCGHVSENPCFAQEGSLLPVMTNHISLCLRVLVPTRFRVCLRSKLLRLQRRRVF